MFIVQFLALVTATFVMVMDGFVNIDRKEIDVSMSFELRNLVGSSND